jgi:hypothetical protein
MSVQSTITRRSAVAGLALAVEEARSLIGTLNGEAR